MAAVKNRQDLEKAARELLAGFEIRWKANGIESSLNELLDLEDTMARPDFWDDQEKARDMSVRKSTLEKKILPWKTLGRELREFPDLIELTFEEEPDRKKALDALAADLDAYEKRFETLLLSEALLGEDDGRNAIVTITPGAGGTESQDWAHMLLRMYMRWFEQRGFQVETVDYQDGEEAGIKNATLIARGENVFGLMKSENGIHRLVRISPFDSNKRRHTSFASVHITPEIEDDLDIEIEKKDIREDTYRASGAGGQHINKTDSAIRITHLPTGIVVQCQNERSQHKNRATAMKMLKAKLYELEKRKQAEDLEARSGEKKDVAWGSQIRSYVFHPYKMVKDLRTDYETSDVDGVMDGDLDPFIEAFLKSLAQSDPKVPAGN